jgi:hypothetical protein
MQVVDQDESTKKQQKSVATSNLNPNHNKPAPKSNKPVTNSST